MQSFVGYEDALLALRRWYSLYEKRIRIITSGKTMTLSRSMSDRPKSSELSVFRTFVAKLMSLQKQMDSQFYTGSVKLCVKSKRYLKKQSVTAFSGAACSPR